MTPRFAISSTAAVWRAIWNRPEFQRAPRGPISAFRGDPVIGRADMDGDLLRHQWRIMRDMVAIAHQDLQRVGTRWQVDNRFGLAKPEMQMVLVVRDWLVQRRQGRIDQQVMVAGVRLIGSSGRHAEVAGTKPNPDMGRADG